jgi:putative spermidine/putrescine transport system substrate-binding protein
MRWIAGHRADLAAMLFERYRASKISRRALLEGMIAIGAVVGMKSRSFAADNELVVANWGGSAKEAFEKAWTEPLKTATGLKLVVDGSGPSLGKIRNMVESKYVTWDVCDSSVGGVMQLGEAGLLEEIDYEIVDKSRVRPQFAYKWGIANYLFSYVMVVNKTMFGGNAPRTWADFWNVKDFPGMRMLRGSCPGVLEAALLADGVAPEKIYPIDVDRALNKIKQIVPNTLFWKTGAQSEDLIRQGDVVAGMMWSNRANLLRIDMHDVLEWPWQGAVLAPAVWMVPKGNPAGKKAAMQFINIALEPSGQIELFRLVGMSPSNPAATAIMPPELRKWDATDPDNMVGQVLLDDEWYGKNMGQVESRFLATIS